MSQEQNIFFNQLQLRSWITHFLSIIDAAAFIELTLDNDEKKNARWKIELTPHQPQGKKEEECQSRINPTTTTTSRM